MKLDLHSSSFLSPLSNIFSWMVSCLLYFCIQSRTPWRQRRSSRFVALVSSQEPASAATSLPGNSACFLPLWAKIHPTAALPQFSGHVTAIWNLCCTDRRETSCGAQCLPPAQRFKPSPKCLVCPTCKYSHDAKASTTTRHVFYFLLMFSVTDWKMWIKDAE